MSRSYSDPLDLIWLRTAQDLGWKIERSAEVYASWDGRDTLTISDVAGMDPDDCLAQMIFHEICHWLVQGPGSETRADWGLENIDESDLVREHACHRLQAALLDPWGLREVLAPTTDHRPYYEALPADPMAECPDPALPLARAALKRARALPWLREALRRTHEVCEAVRDIAPPDSILSKALPLHPSGLPPALTEARCGGCAWFSGTACVRAGRELPAEQGACRLFEAAPLDCAACGACCHRGFHRVELEEDEPAAAHPGAERDDFGLHLPRPGGECVALRGPPWKCTIYADRPRSCAELEIGGEACLEARRRVGLS